MKRKRLCALIIMCSLAFGQTVFATEIVEENGRVVAEEYIDKEEDGQEETLDDSKVKVIEENIHNTEEAKEPETANNVAQEKEKAVLTEAGADAGSAEEKNVVEIQAGESYTTVFDEDVLYSFTPESSSRYHFYSEQNVDVEFVISDETGNVQSFVGYYTGLDGWTYLEKGMTYEISAQRFNPNDEQDDAVTWLLDQVEILSVTEGKSYITSAQESTEYEFIAPEEGYYMLESSNLGACLIYNDITKDIIRDEIYMDLMYGFLSTDDFYPYSNSSGFGAIQYLKKGQSCYINVRSEKEKSEWSIKLLNTVVEKDEFVYRVLADGTIEIMKYVGNESLLEIPEMIDGKMVTSIGYGVFDENEVIQEVTIPSSVTEIKDGAFRHCYGLQKITFSEESNLKYVGNNAFYESDQLRGINLPDTIEKIGDYAFMFCVSLEKVDLGNRLISIGEQAFYESGISGKLVIPDSVTEVGESAFIMCAGLEEVIIGRGMTEIPDRMFYWCGSIKNITIPENITQIGTEAFSVCTSLQSVTLNHSLTALPEGVFSHCSNLKEITIPENITYIADDAFGPLLYDDETNSYYFPLSVIYGYPDTAAQTYAEENGIEFVALDPAYIRGDVDNSGKVDISDLRLVLRSVCGKITLDEQQKTAADVETDGAVNISDLRKILRFVCNKIDEL